MKAWPSDRNGRNGSMENVAAKTYCGFKQQPYAFLACQTLYKHMQAIFWKKKNHALKTQQNLFMLCQFFAKLCLFMSLDCIYGFIEHVWHIFKLIFNSKAALKCDWGHLVIQSRAVSCGLLADLL